MDIAVADACIFIDLFMLELHHQFFEMPLTFHTTYDVYGELNEDQQRWLDKFHEEGKLQIHILGHESRLQITELNLPRSLSEPDRTVLHVALELNAMVLSSDKVIRNCAKRLRLDYHGILWIIEELVNREMISRDNGLNRLDTLLAINPTMPGSKEVMKKVKELRLNWGVGK